jgi:hypothetical protein
MVTDNENLLDKESYRLVHPDKNNQGNRPMVCFHFSRGKILIDIVFDLDHIHENCIVH